MAEVVIIDKPNIGIIQDTDIFPIWRGTVEAGSLYSSTVDQLITKLKSDFYTETEIDELFSINDVGAANFEDYDPVYTYIGETTYYVKYQGTIWKFISDTSQTDVAPDSDPLIWQPVNVGEFAHERDHDTMLASGTDDEVTAADLRLLLDGAGMPLGYVPLNASGKIDDQYMPDLSIVQYLGEVADETAMLALTGEYGDWCIRLDDDKVYVITGADPSQSANWRALSYPGAGLSGSGLADRVTYWTGTGALSYATTTLTELNYLSGVTSSVQTQLDAKANLSGAVFTGSVAAPSFLIGASTVISAGAVVQNVTGNISLWTNDTGYLTTADLSGYATQSWVNSQGFLTSASLSGYVPTTRTITINGTSKDLSADRSWTLDGSDFLTFPANNNVLVSNGTNDFQAANGLTWDGTDLEVTGSLSLNASLSNGLSQNSSLTWRRSSSSYSGTFINTNATPSGGFSVFDVTGQVSSSDYELFTVGNDGTAFSGSVFRIRGNGNVTIANGGALTVDGYIRSNDTVTYTPDTVLGNDSIGRFGSFTIGSGLSISSGELDHTASGATLPTVPANNYINGITVDSFGHVTNLSYATVTTSGSVNYSNQQRIAFMNSAGTGFDYDGQFRFDKVNNYLGVSNNSPQTTIHAGGEIRSDTGLFSLNGSNSITISSGLMTASGNIKANTGSFYGSHASTLMNIGTNGAYHSSRLSVNATSVNTSYDLYVNGTAYASTSFSAGSDERRKKWIDDMEDALDKILQLRPYRYLKDGRIELGLSAQKTQPILPELVLHDVKTDQWGLIYDQLGPLNTKAIQFIRKEQLSDRARIEALERQVAQQDQLIQKLQDR